jgi:hypothetical protein
MSGRDALFAAAPVVLVAPVVLAADVDAPPRDVSAHAACAHRSPAFAMLSPGWTGEAQTPQVVAYFAVIGIGRRC